MGDDSNTRAPAERVLSSRYDVPCAAGFESHLAKPFDRGELRGTVEAALARAGAEKSVSS